MILAAVAALVPAAGAGTAYHYGRGFYGRSPDGVNGAGLFTGTRDDLQRDYNEVWHQATYTWKVQYYAAVPYCVVKNSNNPTKCSNPSNGGSPVQAYNYTDDSGTEWTLETTLP